MEDSKADINKFDPQEEVLQQVGQQLQAKRLTEQQTQTIAKVYSLLRDIYCLSGNFGIALTGMQCLAKEGLMALKQTFSDAFKKC